MGLGESLIKKQSRYSCREGTDTGNRGEGTELRGGVMGKERGKGVRGLVKKKRVCWMGEADRVPRSDG